MATFEHQTLLPGVHVPVNPILVRAIGYLEAYVLSQIWYWQQNPLSTGWVDENGESWVYNSVRKWAEQLGISQSQARHVLDKLRKLKLVFTQKLQAQRWVQDLHYRVNLDRVLEMVSLSQKQKETQKAKTTVRRKASKSSEFAKNSKSIREDSQIEGSKTANDLTNTSTEISSKTTDLAAVDALKREEKKIIHDLKENQVFKGPKQTDKCLELIEKYGIERVKRQLDYEKLRPKAKNSAARLVAAIQHDYAPPVKALEIAEQEQQIEAKTQEKADAKTFLEKARNAAELVIESSGMRYFIDAVTSNGLTIRDPEGNVGSIPVTQILGRAQLV